MLSIQLSCTIEQKDQVESIFRSYELCEPNENIVVSFAEFF